jgi:hypothetical protein
MFTGHQDTARSVAVSPDAVRKIANFDVEGEAFRALLSPESEKRILLFRGASGSGKTTLLNHCLELLPNTVGCVPIHFRETAVGIAEVLFRTGNFLGWKYFPSFTQVVARLDGRVRVSRHWLLGIRDSTHKAMYAHDSGKREEHRAALTESWFADLSSLGNPLLIAFDSYERATTEVQDWIEGPFLARVVQVEHLRILLAGQVVPRMENIEWMAKCSLHNLLGVLEAEHWMPVVRSMKRTISADDPASWLKGVCDVLEGSPRDIMQVIERLPRENAK